MRRARLLSGAALAMAAAGVWVASTLAAGPGAPDRFDLTVPPSVVVAPAADVRVEASATATATAGEATATAGSSSAVVVGPGPSPSSGRVVVSNNGSATANTGGNTGGNTGEHVTTGPATAVGNDSVVVIR